MLSWRVGVLHGYVQPGWGCRGDAKDVPAWMHPPLPCFAASPPPPPRGAGAAPHPAQSRLGPCAIGCSPVDVCKHRAGGFAG